MPSKASGKFVRDQAAIDRYWQHTTEFGWHSRDHPAFAARAVPMGLYGDDCRYNRSGEKLIVLNCNCILQEPKSTPSQNTACFFWFCCAMVLHYCWSTNLCDFQPKNLRLRSLQVSGVHIEGEQGNSWLFPEQSVFASGMELQGCHKSCSKKNAHTHGLYM